MTPASLGVQILSTSTLSMKESKMFTGGQVPRDTHTTTTPESLPELLWRNKQSSTKMRAGPGKSRPRRPAPRSGCSPVQPKSEGLDCCSHMPLQLALLTDLIVARIIWCTPRNEENRFERFSQLLQFVWLSDGKFFFFDVRKVVVVQQGSRLVVYGGAGSSPAVDLRQFEGLVA